MTSSFVTVFNARHCTITVIQLFELYYTIQPTCGQIMGTTV